MPRHINYTQALADLADICQDVTNTRDYVVITRCGKEPVALIAESELANLLETVHLMRSPKNAERLITALNRARANIGLSPL